MENKTDTNKTNKSARLYRGPVTVTIEVVRPTPEEKELPHETQTTVNIKGNRKSGEELIQEIRRQTESVDFFSITIEGPS